MSIRRLSPVLIPFALSFTLAAHAAPLTVIAIKTDTPPTLDGKLDDPVWQQGEWYSSFTLLGEGMKPAAAQTRFKVAFDDQKLYFGIECFEPSMGKLVGTETQRDGHVHRDDCVEMMVDPTGQRVEYYHFTVNVLGTLYDAQMRQGGNVRYQEWNADWQAQVSKGEKSWTVEAAIPFVELGLTAASRGDWALNVARERQAGTPELSSFSEGRGGFHQPALYAVLKLPGADLARYMWAVRNPYEASVHMEGDRLLYSAKTHITNETGRFWFLQLDRKSVV